VAISIKRFIPYINQIPEVGPYIAEMARVMEDGINNLGQHIAVDPAGTSPAPPTPQSLSVKTNGTGLVHVAISDSNPIQKNLHYFVEMDTSPNFPQPHVFHLGPSRTMAPFVLPSSDDNALPQNFYFRSYSQYQGSKPSKSSVYGGNTPTAVNPGGTQQLTLIPSTGSGTASNTGQVANAGFGIDLFRPKG
jgi:hypothetical protein